MTITLPNDILRVAQTKAQAAGFPDLSSYLADLVLHDNNADWPSASDWERVLPEDMIVRSREDLEAKIKEGIESGERDGWIVMTAERRAEIHERARRKAQQS